MKLKPGGGLHYNASTAGVFFLAERSEVFKAKKNTPAVDAL
jgi:hypothetical protein